MNHLIRGGGASARRLASIATMAIALACAVVALAFSTQHADAATTGFCGNVRVQSGDHCAGPNHGSYTATQASESNGVYQVCAGALLNGSFYASYACHGGYAEHCYNGTQTLAGQIHNSETFQLIMAGTEYWAGETCP